MKAKQIRQAAVRYFIIIIAIVLFTSQAFCTETNNKPAPAKSQDKNQAQKETAPEKPKPTKSPLSFRPDMPLREAVDILRNCTVPPLNIVVLWNDLADKADITQNTPIGINGVSGVSIKTHLNLLLLSLSSGGLAELGYKIEGNVIIIATKESLVKKMTTRTYDIADIVAPPSNTMMPGMGTGIGMGTGMMPYGNMMPYTMNGIPGGINPYINSGYPNQGYMNPGYMNQGYMYPGYMNPGYQNQGYINQGISPYYNLNTNQNIGLAPRF